jgi:hypothetical protein
VLSVDVLDATARGATDEKRLATDVAKGAHGRVHPAGNDFFGDSEHFLGERALRVHALTMEQKSPAANREACRFFRKFSYLTFPNTCFL